MTVEHTAANAATKVESLITEALKGNESDQCARQWQWMEEGEVDMCIRMRRSERRDNENRYNAMQSARGSNAI